MVPFSGGLDIFFFWIVSAVEVVDIDRLVYIVLGVEQEPHTSSPGQLAWQHNAEDVKSAINHR